MTAPLFYRGGGFEVTASLLRTPRKTYVLDQVEYVSVARPLLAFAGLPALGLIGFALSFRRYLFAGESVTIIGVSVAVIVIAWLFGTLRVHSLALRGDEVGLVFGPVFRLRKVRAAVETAMALRRRRRP
jgi:uncharacterized membrane protein YGL010W